MVSIQKISGVTLQKLGKLVRQAIFIFVACLTWA